MHLQLPWEQQDVWEWHQYVVLTHGFCLLFFSAGFWTCYLFHILLLCLPESPWFYGAKSSAVSSTRFYYYSQQTLLLGECMKISLATCLGPASMEKTQKRDEPLLAELLLDLFRWQARPHCCTHHHLPHPLLCSPTKLYAMHLHQYAHNRGTAQVLRRLSCTFPQLCWKAQRTTAVQSCPVGSGPLLFVCKQLPHTQKVLPRPSAGDS